MAGDFGRQGTGGPDIRPGDVLGRAFGLLTGNAGAYAFIVMFFTLLERIMLGLFGTDEAQISALLYGGGLPEDAGPGALFALWPAGLVFLVCYCVQQGALSALALDQLAGRPADFPESMLKAGLRAAPLCLVGLAYFAGILGFVMLTLLPVVFGKGLLILCVPAALLLSAVYSATFFVVYPVTVDEYSGVAATFRRSAELTRGQRMKVFGVYLAGSTVALLMLVLTGSGLSAIALAAGSSGVINYFADLAVSLIGGLAVAWLCCISAVVYVDLRSAGGNRQDPAIFD